MGQKLFYRGDFNKNHRSGFSQSSKRKPVEKYDNKFNSKKGPKKQSMITPTYQTLDQFIIGQKGNPKKGDSKSGFSQSKRKSVEKYGNKFNPKKQSMIPTYQMEESKELPEMLDVIKFFGTICQGGPDVGDRKSGDQMGSGPIASQPWCRRSL